MTSRVEAFILKTQSGYFLGHFAYLHCQRRGAPYWLKNYSGVSYTPVDR